MAKKVRKSNKQPKKQSANKINNLIKKNEFWIGVGTFVIILGVASTVAFKNQPLINKELSNPKAKVNIVTPGIKAETETEMGTSSAQIKEGKSLKMIKKLADTKGD